MGRGTVLGWVTMQQEVAVGDELVVLAVAALATVMVLISIIVIGLNAPPVE
jgi:hypothetical protein